MLGQQNVGVNLNNAGQDKSGGDKEKPKEPAWKIALLYNSKAALVILVMLAMFVGGFVAGGLLPHGLAGLEFAFAPGPLPSADRPQFTCAVLVNHTYGSVCVSVPSEPPAAQIHLELLYCAGQSGQQKAGTVVVEGYPQQVARDAYQWVFVPDAPCSGAAEVVVWSDRGVGDTASLQVNVQAAPATATPGKHP
jgi:hypothetical protein